MKHATVLDSETSGFVIGDSAVVNYNADLLEALNVIFDPDGQTNAIESYPGRDWPEVVDAARAKAKAIVDDRLAVVIAAEGYLYITVQDENLTSVEKERVRETKRLRLSTPSGKLTIADGMLFFDEDGRDVYEAEDIDVAPGTYDVVVHSLLPDPEVVPTVGVFGDDHSPAVIVQLAPANSTEECPIETRLDMSHWTREPVSGAICAVTVTKVSKDEARADIHLTAHVSSGKARFAVPEGLTLAVGDERWVLLERHAGAYWTTSLIEE